jgi:phosphoglucosamine mutase
VTLSFGTDGVRGPASEFTPSWVGALGAAMVDVFGSGPFVVGRDTRASGPEIVASLASGVGAGGGAVVDLGVAPTPAVAWVAARDGVPGAVVSASHNPWGDNGIKVFAPGGTKLDDDTEARLADALTVQLSTDPIAGGSGSVRDGDDALDRYVDHLVASVSGRSLAGLSVVLDCANGAASDLAPRVFGDLGASVTVINAEPTGRNINEGCGSTHLGPLADTVVRVGADVGLALDGDADRVLAVDGSGSIVDGDQIIAMLALDRHRRGELVGPAVVVTVMANLGFRLAMVEAGIEVVETPVGDRHCLAALEQRGLVLGGEQSGHVILRDLATTGDGMLSGVQIADLVSRTGRTLADLAASAMTRVPQVLRNVEVRGDREDLMAAIAPVVDAEAARLGSTGRILVRASGTEPLVRVMVEATDAAVAREVASRLVSVVSDHGGAGEPAT